MRNYTSTNRGSWSIRLALLASVALSEPAVAQTPTRPAAKSTKADTTIEQLVAAHNKERAKEKLPPLKLEARLTEAAKEHARDMAEHEKMTHEGTDGSTSAERIVKTGYRHLGCAENVAAGYRTVDQVMEGWIESPGHRTNILGDYTEIGVARVVGKDDKPYWCVNFGKPQPVLVPINPAEAVKDLVKRLNAEREAAKLPALTIDEKLAKAAQDQAAKLARSKSQGGGTASFEGVDQKLYSDLALSTANGHRDASAMVKVLLDRDDLKSQMLGKFSRVGAGYAVSEDGIPYWCVILANPVATPSNRSRK